MSRGKPRGAPLALARSMRRPLLGIAFFFLAGIFAGARLVYPHVFLILAFAPFVLLAAIIFYRLRSKSKLFGRLASVFIYLAIFLAGWLLAVLRVNNPSPNHLSALMDKPREGVDIIGVAADDPALRKSWREDFQYWSFAMRVEEVCRTGAFQKARGTILVSMPTNSAGISPGYGERWQLRGVLIDKVRLAHATGFEAVKFQIPCRFVFRVSDQSLPFLMAAPSPWDFIHWCFVLRQKCAGILEQGIKNRPEAVAILQALVLGRQHELPTPLREAFVATGTYHIFAISGQHVAIIAMFVIVVLQAYGVCRLHWFYYLAPVLIVFTIMTGMSASAVRGCIMAMMCFIGPLFKRKTDIASAMALAALLIVAVDPLQLFQAGFLLSFGIVAGLIVLCPPLIDVVQKKIEPDPWRLEPENIFAWKTRRIAGWFIFMLIASFAAWAVSTPLMARWFNLVSFIALPANLLVIPMATLVLLLGCLSIIFGWCPFVPEIFNSANAFCVSLMSGLTKALAQLPFGHVFVRSPPLWLVCLWFFALVVWRACHAKSVVNYQKRKIWLSAFLILIIAGVFAWLIQRKEWEIHIVNVDRSAVCFVDSGNGSLLVNTGPKYRTRNVLSYLRRLGVNRLRALIFTIPDAGHGGGARDIISALPVKEIILAGTRPESKPVRELLMQADERKINIREMKTGGHAVPLLFSESLGVCLDAIGPAQTMVNVSFKVNQPRFEIVVEEENSSLDRMELFAASTQAVYRVVCHPSVEEREWTPRIFLEDLPAGTRLVLGPGQGVCFTPDRKGVKISATSLGW